MQGPSGKGSGTAADPLSIRPEENPARVADVVRSKQGVVDVGSGVQASHEGHPSKADTSSISRTKSQALAGISVEGEELKMAVPPNGPIVYLLGNRTSHADFERFVRAKEWLLHEDRPSTGPKNPYEQIWVTPDRGTALHYMDDPTPKERFLVLYGRDAGTVAVQLGAANLDIHTSEDVVDRALVASSTPERITVAWQLGVVAKLYDETVLDLLKSLYNGADEIVRSAVINAIGYRGWPEARDFLERVAAHDPSSDLRQNARDIVAAWWGTSTGSLQE